MDGIPKFSVILLFTCNGMMQVLKLGWSALVHSNDLKVVNSILKVELEFFKFLPSKSTVGRSGVHLWLKVILLSIFTRDVAKMVTFLGWIFLTLIL